MPDHLPTSGSAPSSLHIGTATVRTVEDLKQVVEDYLDFDEFAFDIETVGTRQPRLLDGQRNEKDKPALDPMTNEVWAISLAGPGRSDVIPCGHPLGPEQLMKAQVMEGLRPLFFSDRRKINQNVKFDLLSIAKYYGEVPPPPYGDTLILVFLLNENRPSYKLGALTATYLGYEYDEKLGAQAYSVSFERAMRYSIADAKMAWLLWHKIRPQFDKPSRRRLAALLDLEMDVLGVLIQMQWTGAYIDADQFPDLIKKLEGQVQTARRTIKELVGPEFQAKLKEETGKDFNLNSTQHLAKYFYDWLKLRCPHETPKGGRSTDAKAIQVLAKRNEAARVLLQYKDLNKLLSTYIKGLVPHIDGDSRIRASFNQARVKTGRLSCSDPNLQNIPARYKQTFESAVVRQLFQAPPGKKLIVADYSQIELRILAHLSRDKLLLRAYRRGIDVHTQTAALVFGVPIDQVTKDQRAIGKTCNFNFAFEGGAGRVVDAAGISVREARKVYDSWHAAYPGVRSWGTITKEFCGNRKYVETLYGRKRRLPGIHSTDSAEKGYSERQSVNHPIQGLAADIAKIALVQIHEVLDGYDARLVLQVHDEFVIEVAESQVGQVVPLIREAMEDIELDGHPVLDVPLVANINVGNNWAEAK